MTVKQLAEPPRIPSALVNDGVAGAAGGEFSALRQDAWVRAVHAAGTGHIFERRARRLRRKIDVLTYSGIAVPLGVGAVAMGWGVKTAFLPALISVAAALVGVQLLISGWALVRNWTGNLDVATRAFVSNDQLAERFQTLGAKPPSSALEMQHQLELAIATDTAQRQHDNLADVSEKEKRRGMRHALLRYDRRCAKCNVVPTNMKPTNCGVCGDF